MGTVFLLFLVVAVFYLLLEVRTLSLEVYLLKESVHRLDRCNDALAASLERVHNKPVEDVARHIATQVNRKVP